MRLETEPDWRRNVEARIGDANAVIYGDPKAVEVMEQFFLGAATGAHV